MPDNTIATETIIQIERVSKWFGDFQVLQDIDLTVRHGERVVVCGPSGSGKSTLIRCINRLEEHQSGRIVVDGNELVQPISSSYCVGKLYPGANAGQRLNEERSQKPSHGVLGASKDTGAGAQTPQCTFRWPATACCNCTVTMYGAAYYAF